VPPLRGRARVEALGHRWLEDRGLSDELSVNGYRLEVSLDDLIGRSIYLNGIWERQNTEAIKVLARPGDSIFDVGANIGYYCLLFSRLVGVEGRVFAFEPVPLTLAALRGNLARNEGTANIAVVEKALSDEPKQVQINVSGSRNTGASHVVSGPVDDAGRTRAGVASTIAIDAVRGDDFWASAGRPDVRIVKIDIEGHELHALRGMEGMLRSLGRLVVMVEIRDRFLRASGGSAEALFRLLKDCGYSSYDFELAKRRFIRNDEIRDGELVCFSKGDISWRPRD
jgi:FkbM family methyltransferase